MPIKLFLDAVHGKYNKETFTPEWISREDFFRLKDTDPYVKYIWSFAYNGNDYVYGKHIENYKKDMHNFCVHKILIPDIDFDCESDDYTERRMLLRHYLSKLFNTTNERVIATEHLKRLERLANLEQLANLERLETCNMDYKQYKYQEGDVVYCDIPYQDTNIKGYLNGTFNHQEFYDWARSKEYPVFFSSYELPELLPVFSTYKQNTLSATKSIKRLECIYKL